MKTQVRNYYRDLLQLDANLDARHVRQNNALVNKPSKFPWQMMLMNMDEVKILTDFFRKYVADEKKGVRVLLTRIDDFNDANSSDEE